MVSTCSHPQSSMFFPSFSSKNILPSWLLVQKELPHLGVHSRFGHHLQWARRPYRPPATRRALKKPRQRRRSDGALMLAPPVRNVFPSPSDPFAGSVEPRGNRVGTSVTAVGLRQALGGPAGGLARQRLVRGRAAHAALHAGVPGREGSRRS